MAVRKLTRMKLNAECRCRGERGEEKVELRVSVSGGGGGVGRVGKFPTAPQKSAGKNDFGAVECRCDTDVSCVLSSFSCDVAGAHMSNFWHPVN